MVSTNKIKGQKVEFFLFSSISLHVIQSSQKNWNFFIKMQWNFFVIVFMIFVIVDFISSSFFLSLVCHLYDIQDFDDDDDMKNQLLKK